MTTLSVVIPAYNEEDGIAAIVERVLAIESELPKYGVDTLECIVVDDGSRDRTAEIVRRYVPRVRLIQQPNKGYGGALKTGFQAATGELLGFLDADSTYPPEYFPQMCKIALDGADLVIGSRMAGATSEMPLVRRIGNFIFASCSRWWQVCASATAPAVSGSSAARCCRSSTPSPTRSTSRRQ